MVNEEEEAYRQAQKAKHAVLNGQISDGARALVQPGLLRWSQHIIDQMESIHKVAFKVGSGRCYHQRRALWVHCFNNGGEDAEW